MHERRVAEIVEAAVEEDLGASLEPDGLSEGEARIGLEKFGEEAAERRAWPSGRE